MSDNRHVRYNSDLPESAQPLLKGTLIVTTQGRTAFDYHASKRYEITTDLNQDEIGEYVTQEINKAWQAGIDPASDGLTIFLQFA